MNNNYYILGIETSCDDTSVAVINEKDQRVEVISHVKFGQEELLKNWGGVVPEIAARNHLEKITPLIKDALLRASIEMTEINLIAVTTTPGLLGPLLTGVNAAKTLSLIHKLPICSVNHLYAHLEAIHITEEVSYPYLGLLISGGHSIYFWVENSSSFKVLGSTIDDAAGEAFDKGGKILELGYPAGHIVDRLASFGNPKSFEFPVGLKSSADARLSFSGLKTALRVFLEKNPNVLDSKPTQFDQKENESQLFYDVCASYQHAISTALLLKLRYAIKKVKDTYSESETSGFTIVIGGGVACNSYIRSELVKKYPNSKFVAKQYCTDNGAMIANYGRLQKLKAIEFPKSLRIDARGRFIDKKDFLNEQTSKS